MKKMMLGYCYVVGDILHRGHIMYLRNCKALCDKLICGVLTDKAVMEKNPRPIMSLDERMALVELYVDAVVSQDKYSPLENCRGIKPDILFENTSHKTQPANKFIKNMGGRVIELPYYPNQSSTKIKSKLKK